MSWKKWVQLALAALLLAAGVRVAVIFYERHSGPEKGKVEAPPLPEDYYIIPRKLHDYDAASLRKDLVGHSAWVREGYRFSIFPVVGGRADLGKAAGMALPIEKLDVSAVITAPTPGAPGQQQILVVFPREGKDYGLPVGVTKGKEATIFADEVLFYDDPRALYKHWPPDVWDAIGRHEIRLGMNEWQVSFAIGMGIPDRGSDTEKTVHYPNGGHALAVRYRDGKAAEIKPE